MFSRALSNAVSFITEVVITSTITLFLFIIEPLIATVTISIFLILSLMFYYVFKPKLSSYGHKRQNFLKTDIDLSEKASVQELEILK